MNSDDDNRDLASENVDVVERIRSVSARRDFRLVAISRSGPLPSPQELAAYDQAMPGLANRIVQMAEMSLSAQINEGRSDTELRAEAIRDYWRTIRDRNGLWSIVALAAIGLDAYLAHLNVWAGTGVGAFELTAILVAYFRAQQHISGPESSGPLTPVE